jgi:hypothetical protein
VHDPLLVAGPVDHREVRRLQAHDVVQEFEQGPGQVLEVVAPADGGGHRGQRPAAPARRDRPGDLLGLLAGDLLDVGGDGVQGDEVAFAQGRGRRSGRTAHGAGDAPVPGQRDPGVGAEVEQDAVGVGTDGGAGHVGHHGGEFTRRDQVAERLRRRVRESEEDLADPVPGPDVGDDALAVAELPEEGDLELQVLREGGQGTGDALVRRPLLGAQEREQHFAHGRGESHGSGVGRPPPHL